MPCTDLNVVGIPDQYEAAFAFLRDIPVCFFRIVRKVNRTLFVNRRICIITDYTCSLASKSGKVLRCFKVEDIDHVVAAPRHRFVGIRMRDRPRGVGDDVFRQHSFFEMPVDTLIEFSEAEDGHAFVDVLTAVFRHCTGGGALTVEEAKSESAVCDQLILAPDGSRTKQSRFLKRNGGGGAAATATATPAIAEFKDIAPPPETASSYSEVEEVGPEAGHASSAAVVAQLQQQLAERDALMQKLRRYNYSHRCELDDLKRALSTNTNASINTTTTTASRSPTSSPSPHRGKGRAGNEPEHHEPAEQGGSSSTLLESLLHERYAELPTWLQDELRSERQQRREAPSSKSGRQSRKREKRRSCEQSAATELSEEDRLMFGKQIESLGVALQKKQREVDYLLSKLEYLQRQQQQ